jgi:hypothetical protein
MARFMLLVLQGYVIDSCMELCQGYCMVWITEHKAPSCGVRMVVAWRECRWGGSAWLSPTARHNVQTPLPV